MGDSPLRLVRYGNDAAGPWLGFQAWRAQLDALLLERAREVGADYHESCRALTPLVAGGRVVGVETSAGARQADFVVDAAGPQHWLARRLGLDIGYWSPPLKARFGYAEGLCVVRDETPALVADEAGWTWTAKVREGLYHWTRLNLDGSVPDSKFMPEEFDGLDRRGRSRSADVSWRAMEESAGPGYFAVGDAAAVLDPTASHGVLKALLSGILAGRLITEVLVVGRDPEAATSSYRNSLGAWFSRDVHALRALYERLASPPTWLGGAEGSQGASRDFRHRRTRRGGSPRSPLGAGNVALSNRER